MRRFSWACCAILSTLLVSAGMWSAWGGDDPPNAEASVSPGQPEDPAGDAIEDGVTDEEGIEDLTDSIAIEKSAPRKLAAGMYAIDVRLKNQTKMPIDGPLFLVVEEVGVPGTSLRFRDIDQVLRDSIESDQDDDDAEEAESKAEDAIAAPVAERVADQPVAVEIVAGDNDDDDAEEAVTLPGYEPPFVVENCRGWTDWDEPYFLVVPGEKRLLPGRVAPVVEVQVRALEPFTDEELAQLEIKVWVTRQQDPDELADGEDESEELDEASQNALDAALEISNRHTDEIMAIEGVQGMGVGQGDARSLYGITIYVEAPGAKLPKEIEGLPVRVRIVGQFRPHWNVIEVEAQATARSPRSKFSRPVPTGVSIGNGGAGGSGTLGCRVRRNGLPHILSNNHVLVPMSHNLSPNWSTVDKRVYQPGLADAVRKSSNIIANLNSFVRRRTNYNNRMDAALARTTTGNVGKGTQTDSGKHKGYGMPRRTPSNAYPSLQVMKYGRTTSLTHGKIDAIGVTINQNSGGGRVFRFVKQITIVAGDQWSKSGDSGSLVVTKRGRNPVGLHHSGSSGGKFGVASPIKTVLSTFDAKIEGSTLKGRPASYVNHSISNSASWGTTRTINRTYSVPSGKRWFRWEWSPTCARGVSGFKITKVNDRTVRLQATVKGGTFFDQWSGCLNGRLRMYYE